MMLRGYKILTTHGLKGDVKVQSFSDFDRIYKGAKLYIKHKNEYIWYVY